MPKSCGHDLHVLVEGLPFVLVERADERLVHDEGGVDERPVHPQEQPGLPGGVAGSGRVGAELRRDRPLHARMDRPHAGRGPVSFGPRAVDDGVDRAHRAGEPPPRTLPVARMGDYPGRDEWVSGLHEQGVAAAEHEHGLAGDPPDRALRREVAPPRPVRAHQWCMPLGHAPGSCRFAAASELAGPFLPAVRAPPTPSAAPPAGRRCRRKSALWFR